MQQTGKAAVAKVTMREKEHLCVVRLVGDALSLSMMYFQDEIRSTEELGITELTQKVQVRPEEMEMAVKLVDNLTDQFTPEKYHDAYREELLSLIRAKVEGEDFVTAEAPAPEVAGNVIDLMERLRQSVAATQKKGRQERCSKKEKSIGKLKKFTGNGRIIIPLEISLTEH